MPRWWKCSKLQRNIQLKYLHNTINLLDHLILAFNAEEYSNLQASQGLEKERHSVHQDAANRKPHRKQHNVMHNMNHGLKKSKLNVMVLFCRRFFQEALNKCVLLCLVRFLYVPSNEILQMPMIEVYYFPCTIFSNVIGLHCHVCCTDSTKEKIIYNYIITVKQFVIVLSRQTQ